MPEHNQKELVKSIKRHEAFRGKVYEDSLGYPTIGDGLAIKDLVLSVGVADMILKEKLLQLIAEIRERFNWFHYMPEQIQNVIIEMCYQMGIGGFMTFPKTIGCFQTRQWKEAAREMLDSTWHKQTPKRAEELAGLVENCSAI